MKQLTSTDLFGKDFEESIAKFKEKQLEKFSANLISQLGLDLRETVEKQKSKQNFGQSIIVHNSNHSFLGSSG